MEQLSSPSPHIQGFRDGSIAWLVLNRPERRNALSRDMWAAIPAMMKCFDDDISIRVVVIRGHGREAFAAGADISEFGEARSNAAAARAYEDLNGAALAAIRACSKPVIAMIHGYCIGGGLAIALACDLRVSDDSASFALPPARLGLAYPQDGLHDLVAVAGAATAKDMIFTARRLKAPEALHLGLINRLSADVEAEVRSICTEIANGAPLTITHAKRAIDRVSSRPGHLSESEIAKLSARCFDSEDYAEGRAAFAAKRKPQFRGA
jgi:enoyl-CoA hydratase/carnithine racemase